MALKDHRHSISLIQLSELKAAFGCNSAAATRTFPYSLLTYCKMYSTICVCNVKMPGRRAEQSNSAQRSRSTAHICLLTQNLRHNSRALCSSISDSSSSTNALLTQISFECCINKRQPNVHVHIRYSTVHELYSIEAIASGKGFKSNNRTQLKQIEIAPNRRGGEMHN